jgi:hypothetical protein
MQWEEFGTVPASKKSGPSKDTRASIKQQHIQFVIEMVYSYTPMTLDQMRQRFPIEFLDLMVSRTAFYSHVRQHCASSFKRPERILVKRNPEEVRLKQKSAMLEWMSTKNMYFEKEIVYF